MMFSENQFFNILCALFAGVFIGAIYDVFRIIRCAFFIFLMENDKKNQKKPGNRNFFEIILQIILDLLFSIVYTIIIVLLVYYLNNGFFRLYIALFAAAGFAVYYFTLGRLVMKISDVIIHFIKLSVLFVLKCVWKFLLRPVLVLLCIVFGWFVNACILSVWNRLRTAFYIAKISSKVKEC